MRTEEKRTLTYIGKDPFFRKTIKKLTTDVELKHSEKVYILSCAILFLKQYAKDKRYTSYADFAYSIILKYSLHYNDYTPLFDYSINFGFYPIAKSILDKELLNGNLITNCLSDIKLDRFNNNNYVETLEQHNESKKFLEDESNEKSYLAPTSFGKSSIIVDHIKNLGNNLKIVIVVPTKSLLMQTYHMIRDADLGRKIIIHDEMYNNESSFIAVFTQERSLRLLGRKDVCFDVMFIDEAHNILKKGSRSILLSRLIAKNRASNSDQKVIYLSPLIDRVENLRITDEQIITSHVINFNIKEPEIFEYRLNKEVVKFNRFVKQFYEIDQEIDKFDYLKKNFTEKNFLYNYRPIKIELLAKDLCENLPKIELTQKVLEIALILKREVHESFYAIKYLRYGLVYLHGKLPDLIKEYLEYKYKTLPELKYVIANSVILEGMNLPIDSLFIFNTYSLQGKELMNLIGRVNRLNSIFSADSNELNKLLPRVHFINSEEHNPNSKMTNKIELLRSRVFVDKVENPILDSFDIEKYAASKKEEAEEKYRKKIKAVQDNEGFINTYPDSEADKIKVYLIEAGINEFYTDADGLIEQLIFKIESIKRHKVDSWESLPMMEKIDYLFIRDLTEGISDFEIKRLSNEAARNYYENHILVGQKKSLKENINSQFKYFAEKALRENSKLYFGSAYGEESLESDSYPESQKKTYVDLSTKGKAELVNLAIVKLKMEDEFISFKLNKFIVMMFDYEIITNDEYNLYIYGTTDKRKIELTKYGLSISLVSRLEKDGQLENMSFDQFNNLKGNANFEKFVDTIDDFYKFEISRYLH